MLENTTPVMKSTLSRLTSRSKACLATFGLNWSSTMVTSAGRPPSLPPLNLTASMKASRMSTPSAAEGPDKVLTKPTLTLSLANAGRLAVAARRDAAVRPMSSPVRLKCPLHRDLGVSRGTEQAGGEDPPTRTERGITSPIDLAHRFRKPRQDNP